MSKHLSRFVSVSEVERQAIQLLPQSVRDYYQSGADDEQTLARNSKMFSKYLIRPLALRDVSKLDPRVRICLKDKDGNVAFDHVFDYPLAIAPSAFQRLAHPDGEKATAKAAGQTNTLMVNSTISTTRLEEVAQAGAPHHAHLFFQLYVYKDRQLTETLVRRAERAGFKALVLTVDAPAFGRRRADERNGFELPAHLEMANFSDQLHAKTSAGSTGSSGLAEYTNSLFDQSLNWSDLKWLVEFSKLPIEALPEVVKAVQKRVPVFVDGGFRCGTDIFKAVALGADLCFIGRPVLHGLAVGGADGVKHVLKILHTEFRYALMLSGCASIDQIRNTKDIVVHERYYAKI